MAQGPSLVRRRAHAHRGTRPAHTSWERSRDCCFTEDWNREPCCLTEIWWSGELQGTLVTSVSRGNVVAGLLPRSQLGSSAGTIRTAGGTACVNNHVDSKRTGIGGSSHPAAERTSITARDGRDDTHTRKRKPCTASAEHDRHATTARASRNGRHW